MLLSRIDSAGASRMTQLMRLFRVLLLAVCAIATTLIGLPVNAQDLPSPVGPPFVTSARPSYWVRNAQSTDPDCFCWAHGRKYGAGQRTCLRTIQGMRMALCDRVTNLMSWSPSDEPCGES
jgi:hypothetical protein